MLKKDEQEEIQKIITGLIVSVLCGITLAAALTLTKLDDGMSFLDILLYCSSTIILWKIFITKEI